MDRVMFEELMTSMMQADELIKNSTLLSKLDGLSGSLVQGIRAAQRRELIGQLADKLNQLQAFMATAESCTGGGIAQALTAVAGSSTWFDAGFVTYSNQAKSRMLGVPAAVIAEHGAVSEAVVKAMVAGAVANSEASFAVSVSGVAGPGGGSPEKPVGTVWIAWGGRSESVGDDIQAECFLFGGDREAVREQTIDTALSRLLGFLS